MSTPMLSTIVFVPALAALFILFVPRQYVGFIRWLSTVATGFVLACTVCLVVRFDRGAAGMQFVEKLSWIPKFNIQYFLGVDGLSIGLVFLTALLGFLACIASFSVTRREKEYFALYLLLMTGMLGTFVALDLFLFYVFWEMVLIPMYFLIAVWGGERREYAAVKFFLYTLAGSVLMLAAILLIFFTSPAHSFDMLILAKHSGLSAHLQIILFIAFYLGFAVKVPLFPFHTWLPDAHVEAPTPISVLLAGVLLKMGAYGFFRICLPIMPQGLAFFAPLLAVLATINIVYGAYVAMAQTDFKKMIAYSSVSHMGFVMLGLASMSAAGFNGAIMGMFNHGIITGAMFLLVGVLYERAHTRDMGRFGGLSIQMPVYAGLLTFFSLASLGLPGLSGFVGEFLALIGAYEIFPVLTILSVLGLVIVVGFFLYMLQRVLFGSVQAQSARYPDITAREIFTLAPLLLLTLLIGFYPSLFLQFQEITVSLLLKIL